MANDSDQNVIKSGADFDSSPAGLQRRWHVEITASQKAVEAYHTRGKRILDRFQDRRNSGDPDEASRASDETRLNLFTSNIQTRRAMLYGKVPRCEVSRRYADPNDAVARVAALMLTRLLNLDIETESDDYAAALGLALDDFQLVGLGAARVRYEATFRKVPAEPAQVDPATGAELAPALPEREEKDSEFVHVDYVHWRDLLWSPARVWHEIRWLAYRAYMSRDDFKARFGEEHLPHVAIVGKTDRDDREDGLKHDPWERIEVWEIWSKDDRKVYWYTRGAQKILDQQDDPLGLSGFFPTPQPLASNLTSDAFMPVPDFVLAQDIYDEIDEVSTRIRKLERAIKVVGVYDSSSDGVQRMLSEGCDNELVPVDNWAMFAERGGIKGQVDWLPIDQVVMALVKAREYRTELVQLLYEVTGMSDIVRGSSNADETATAQAIKAKFASTRMQAAQDEFARFATDLLRLKAELILTHCEDQFILDGSNIGNTVDAQLAPQALQLLRDEKAKFRIEVKPENISITNFKEMQSERMAVLQGMTGFLQAAGPIITGQPQAAPFLLELLKWTLAGFRGSASIEGVIDQAIGAVKQQLANPPPPQADPKLEGIKAQTQAKVVGAKLDIQKRQAEHEIDKQQLALDFQRAKLDMARDMAQMRMEATRPAPQPGAQEAR